MIYQNKHWRHKMLTKRLAKDRSGFLLATVILFTMVLTVVAISIMSLNVSQSISGQAAVDSIKAEELAKGAFYRQHQLQLEGCPAPACSTAGDCSTCLTQADETLDYRTFSFNIVDGGTVGGGFNDTNQYNVIVNY